MRRDIFPTPLWEYDLPIDGKKLITYILSLDIKNSDNFNLWDYIQDSTCPLGMLKQVIHDHALSSIQQIYPEASVTVGRSWINTQGFGQGLPAHHHGVELVACLYLNADPDTGDLILIDPRGSVQWKIETEGKYTGVKGFRIQPKNGRLIIFPGYVIHYVTENTTQKFRISLATNIVVNFD